MESQTSTSTRDANTRPSSSATGIILNDILNKEFADAVLVSKLHKTPAVDDNADNVSVDMESINSEKPICAVNDASISRNRERLAGPLRRKFYKNCFDRMQWFAVGFIGCSLLLVLAIVAFIILEFF
ncbi:hypothetical protein Tcan_07100 [Toxocara canis]|uniref:Uncharacterized protein n=1 Tax=Toxocara canis TaxID=6265 RepID=A0A0B2VUC1_TOXCA|nr:hypothetical protein Tcan_07100 [Toxocara canis]